MLQSAVSGASLTGQTSPAIGADPNSLLIDVKDLGFLIGVSTATCWRMRSAAKLPPEVKLSPGCVRWRRSDVERWVSLGCPTRQQFLDLTK